MMALRAKLIAAGAGVVVIALITAAIMFRAEIREGARLAADLETMRGALETQRAESELLREGLELEREINEGTRARVYEIQRDAEAARNEMRGADYDGPYQDCRDVRLDDAVVDRLRELATD